MPERTARMARIAMSVCEAATVVWAVWLISATCPCAWTDEGWGPGPGGTWWRDGNDVESWRDVMVVPAIGWRLFEPGGIRGTSKRVMECGGGSAVLCPNM
ncbi:hypothetical protein GW17_00031976 [Ensete ventricosum]|nr:hypothetical protein GW17_00031976 [Ensete ventricosum]